MNVTEAIELLGRFPQCGELAVIGDRGLDDLRVFAPIDGNSACEKWNYYRIDTPTDTLPWLRGIQQ